MASLAPGKKAGFLQDRVPSKYLLIVRASDASLHPNWLNPPGWRIWDLHISYFGE